MLPAGKAFGGRIGLRSLGVGVGWSSPCASPGADWEVDKRLRFLELRECRDLHVAVGTLLAVFEALPDQSSMLRPDLLHYHAITNDCLRRGRVQSAILGPGNEGETGGRTKATGL